MEKFVQNWKRVPAPIRKPLVLIAGIIIIIAGILLLPLPGPGWVIIIAGLALLATEFERAEQIRNWVFRKLKAVINKIR